MFVAIVGDILGFVVPLIRNNVDTIKENRRELTGRIRKNEKSLSTKIKGLATEVKELETRLVGLIEMSETELASRIRELATEIKELKREIEEMR